MPARSKSQQRLMGMVYNYKSTGELPDNPDLVDEIKKIAASISKEDAKKFAETKHKDLPEVKESMTFKQYLMVEGNIVIDTDSAEDSQKVIEVLDDSDIRYTKQGPKLTIGVERDSLKGASLISHFDRIGVRFQDLSET